MRLPWWGTVWHGGALPVLILFDHFGKLALARPTLASAAIVTIAIALRWKLRWHAWFWGTMISIAALHVRLILFVPWTTKWVQVFVIIPIGSGDLYLILWILAIVGKLRATRSTDTRFLEGTS
jgi:hypothetical protein